MIATLRPPRIVRTRRISPLAALYELGLDESYPPQAKADLLAAIRRGNNDLIHSFGAR